LECNVLFIAAELASLHVTAGSSMEIGKLHHSSRVEVTGSRIDVACASVTEDILLWDYYRHRASRPTTIYSSGNPRQRLDARFQLDCHDNNCSLEIGDLQLKDAGRFVCQLSHSIVTVVSLTVLGTYQPTTASLRPKDQNDHHDHELRFRSQ